MKDNARNDQGSTRSLPTPLSQSATPRRRFRTIRTKCDRYATKMLPNFKTQIVIHSTPAAYNFDPQKRSHFPVLRIRPCSPNRATQPRLPNPAIIAFRRTVEGYSFSLGEKVRMRDKLVISRLLTSPRRLPLYCTVKTE
jgi:hypothetical protein